MRFEVRRQRVGHHAAMPGSPADGLGRDGPPGFGTPRRFGAEHLVEHFVRHRVIGLADVPRAARHGRERADHLEWVARGRPQERV